MDWLLYFVLAIIIALFFSLFNLHWLDIRIRLNNLLSYWFLNMILIWLSNKFFILQFFFLNLIINHSINKFLSLLIRLLILLIMHIMLLFHLKRFFSLNYIWRLFFNHWFWINKNRKLLLSFNNILCFISWRVWIDGWGVCRKRLSFLTNGWSYRISIR